MGGEYDYGNARLRAMATDLLGARDYERLSEVDLDGLLGALARTRYGPDLEAAVPRARGIHRLHEMLRRHLGRTLSSVRSFFPEPARRLLDLVLARWETRNLQAILRGLRGPGSRAGLLERTVPTGPIPDGLYAELASQPDARAALERMTLLDLPDRRTARAALAAFERAEGGDPVALDLALDRERAARMDRELSGGGYAEDLVARILRAEVDATNLVSAARIAAAVSAGDLEAPPPAEGEGAPYLPGGRVPAGDIARIADAESLEAAAKDALRLRLPSAWREVIASWSARPTPARLERALGDAIAREAASFLRREDPLSVGVPLAFIYRKETEVRNLRLLGAAAVLSPAGAELRDDVLLLDEEAARWPASSS